MIWKNYVKWANKLQTAARRSIVRPDLASFLVIDRESWLIIMSHCEGSLCRKVLPNCRADIRSHHDYILKAGNSKFRLWALKWRRGVFAINAHCPVCKLQFRQSHVVECNLLNGYIDSSTENYLLEDIALFKNRLPNTYCCIDAALNHKAISGVISMLHNLCKVLGVSINDI